MDDDPIIPPVVTPSASSLPEAPAWVKEFTDSVKKLTEWQGVPKDVQPAKTQEPERTEPEQPPRKRKYLFFRD